MRLFVSVFVSLILFGCSSDKEFVPVVKLGGEIANDRLGYFTLEPVLAPIDIARRKASVIDTIEVDTNWFFLTDLDYEEGEYILSYADEFIFVYLTPGKSLNINMEAAHPFESRKFSAGTKYPTRFLNDRQEVINQIADERLFQFSESAFLKKLDSSRKTLDTLLVEFITAKPTWNQEFFKDYSLRNYYYTTAQMMLYDKERIYFNDTLSPVSESFFEFTKGFNFNDTLALNGVHYILTIQLIMDRDLEQISISEAHTSQEKLASRFHWIDSTMSPGLVKDFFIASSLKNHIAFDFHSQADSIINTGLSSIQDSALEASVLAELQSREHLMPGNAAPEIVGVDTAGNTFKLSDFKGKVVYIDFWATWCGPCIEALPALDKLRKKYSNDAFEVIQLSLDNSKLDWMRHMYQQSPKGTHLYATNGWDNTLVKTYAVAGIPRYVLVDKEGRLIDASADSPNSDQLFQLIDAAID